MFSYDRIHEWQTRLTLIKPNADDTARLELNIIVVDLVDLDVGAVINHERIVMYDALSYAWGDTEPSVECDCNGSTILLRDNLASALRYLRQPWDERYVWIDYLCIDQHHNTEKSFQIPRMRRIYSGASLVLIWLGESHTLESALRQCNQKCGLNKDLFLCETHKEESLKHVLEYAWFQRTWVRQEVYAAKTLDICSPYFSTSWERFMEPMTKLHSASNQRVLENLDSLNNAYHALREFQEKRPTIRLLDLLKQGTGFQASVPHDHIFSVLGMVPTPPKDLTRLIPITYNKPYHEVCGDVTRFIIRETRSIRILQLCPLQRNRTYAFDWPTLKWSSQVVQELRPESIASQEENEMEWFDIENPIKEDGSLTPSDISSTLDQSIAGRPLILYGNVWGVLSSLSDKQNHGRVEVPIYGAKDPTDQDPESKIDSSEDIEENHEFIIVKHGLTWWEDQHSPDEQSHATESMIKWKCCGCGKEGDIFVSFEPGPTNILLRRCPGLDELFEIVGWGGEGQYIASKKSPSWIPVELEHSKTNYLAWNRVGDMGYFTDIAEYGPGKKRRFQIR